MQVGEGRIMRRVLALSVLGVTLLLGAACASSSAAEPLTSDAGQTVSDRRLAAFDVCKQFVAERLRSPGSAEWRDPYGDQVRYLGDGEEAITVTASVDSQNGFGALLRSEYECMVRHAEGDTWNLVNLNLEEGSG